MPTPKPTSSSGSNVLAARPPPGSRNDGRRDQQRRSRRCVPSSAPRSQSDAQCRSVDQRLEPRVGLLDRSRGGGVARLGLGRLVLRRPGAPDRPARPRARAAPPRPASTACSAFCWSLRRFFDGPFGFALRLRLRRRVRRRWRSHAAVASVAHAPARRSGACAAPDGRRHAGLVRAGAPRARSSRTRTYSGQPPR